MEELWLQERATVLRARELGVASDFQLRPECDKVIPHGILRSGLPDEERR